MLSSYIMLAAYLIHHPLGSVFSSQLFANNTLGALPFSSFAALLPSLPVRHVSNSSPRWLLDSYY
jgi:hypothetical protein